MPVDVWNAQNGSSSEEEESDDEVVPVRRGANIRIMNTPQQAKAQVLDQIKQVGEEIRAHESVASAPVATEKTDEEKRALEERQKQLQQEAMAKAQQAAAIQAAAAKAAQAQAQSQNQAQSDAQEQAQAALRAQQQAAIKAAQEQAMKAQQEALAKAQAAKAQAEAQAKSLQEAQQRAQQEALARAQAAKSQAESQAKSQADAQARAQQEALAKAQAAKSQAEAQAKAQKAQQEALAKAQAAKAQAEAQAKAQAAKTQADAQAKAAALAKTQQDAQAKDQAAAKAQADAQAKTQAQQKAQQEALAKAQAAKAQAEAQAKAKTTAAHSQMNGSVQNGGLKNQPAKPATQQKQAAAAPATAPKPSPSAPAPQIKAQPDPVSQQVVGQHQPSRIPQKSGKVGGWNPDTKDAQPKETAPIDRNSTLKQTAKQQEDQLANEQTKIVGGIHAAKPAIRQQNVVEKFVEKEEVQPEKQIIGKACPLAGAVRWQEDSLQREQQLAMGQDQPAPQAVRLQDDSCWMTQHRIPVEIQPPQVGKISIPELSDGHEVQKSVIMSKPQAYQKVKWNEFPDEFKPEIGAAPKTKTQDWVPVNQEQSELQRSLYTPARISRAWPPPEDEIVKEAQEVSHVKAGDDFGWIQQEQNPTLRSAAWSNTAKINRVWPPPEDESNLKDFGTQHMPSVQWPPAETEQHEREQVEVLQKHIPTKKMERQWPPPPPQYQVVEQTGNPDEENLQPQSAHHVWKENPVN